MAWYDSAVFYHIYPLGLCGCPHDNNGETGAHFDKLNEWAEHAKRIVQSKGVRTVADRMQCDLYRTVI